MNNPKNVAETIPSVFNDDMTDIVYISDKLKYFFPDTYNRLTRLFDEMDIKWDEVKGTKDIWIRDYMPIQIAKDSFLVYDYAPDYLKGKDLDYKTDSHNIFVGYIPGCQWKDVGIKLDGGNVVPCCDSYILTDKVFTENGYEKNDPIFFQYLQNTIHKILIIIPWHCNNPDDPHADVYGHADGFVRWTHGRHVLMSNHRDTEPEEAGEIRRRLENAGFEVTEMLFDVPNPNTDFNWAYINYLEVGDKIVMPAFGIPEDKQALKYIKDSHPHSTIRTFRMRDIASKGGALHCITWNIKEPYLPF